MTNIIRWDPEQGHLYLLGSRILTHIVFWLVYYLLFSLVWVRSGGSLFASFYLEFILMPIRIMAVYGMLYLLMPRFLQTRKYLTFFTGYVLFIGIAGTLQMFISVFFYQNLLVESAEHFSLSMTSWLRSCLLINTTVLLIGALKVFQWYIRLLEQQNINNEQAGTVSDSLTVKADKRFYRIPHNDILYVEGMGNYVNYHLKSGERKTVYASLKDTLEQLPDTFLRLHRSYVINRQHLDSFNAESVFIQGTELPRGKDIADSDLTN